MKRYISINPVEPQYQKRIKDHLLLAKCITILFNFFKQNEIGSSVDQVSSYESLLKIIIESKVTNFSFNPNTDEYTISIKPKISATSSSVYFFVFGNTIINNYLLVEMDEENIQSRIKLSLNCDKYLPFIAKYEYEIESSQIMSLDEFVAFLEKNKRPGRLKVIEVP